MSAIRELYYRLPDGLRRAILVRRRSSDWLSAGIVFIHIPKAAGTSINLALYGRFIGHVRALDVERWGSKALRSLPSFAVTRNPWERLVSAYRFAKRGRGVGGGYQAGLWHSESYQRPEFENFESFVKQWLAPRDPLRLDGIFQPQWVYVCDDEGKLLVDHLGRLEHMAPTYDFLREHLGAVPPISESNRSGDAIDYRGFYTPELVDLVGRIYAKDVERFGYSFER